MAKYIIAAHRGDLDGIVSHAIIHRYLKEKNPTHIFVDYDTVKKDFEKIEKIAEPGAEIYVADFNINRSDADSVLAILSKLKNRGCNIYWYDHHEWKINMNAMVKLVKDIWVDVKKCGAEVACWYLMKDDPFSNNLAKIAGDYDMWRRRWVISFKLSLLINNRIWDDEKLLEMINTFVSGKMWEKDWDDEYKLLKKEYDKDMKKILKTSKEYHIKDKIIVTVYNDSKVVSNSEAGGMGVKKHRKKMKLPAADVIVMVTPTAKASFRRKRKNSGVPLDEIAVALGGGGHPYAASGNIQPREAALVKQGHSLNHGRLLRTIEEYLFK